MERTITIDRVGRLVIPRDVRRRHCLAGGSQLRIIEEKRRIVLEPIAEETPLIERGGLLIATAPMEGSSIDHRELREERLEFLSGQGE